MRRVLVLAAACLLLSQGSALTQHAQPYADLEDREIKALSTEEIADLLAGRGMGLALAAELNGYPGPLHTLELADELELTAEQRHQVQELYEVMQREAIALGQQVVELEAHLDRQFAEQTVTSESLEAVTAEIGKTQAELRATHLRYHLSTREILTPEQIASYATLRGYRTDEPHPPGGHQHGTHGH